ncbi:FG-GAP repeat protein [Pseudovibrio ascidiaceicola]|uniref:FG-GAP repeat protein n=1 Tax=Pseudovibrio ascidiaceicola TaxID=285279 RepID=UPI002452CDCF|nr:FG-GAP repeat protein [Pseudovibrio ascidiaceicola]
MASDGSSVDVFGYRAVINNSDVIAVSAHGDDDAGESAGAIYVFNPTEGGGYSEIKLNLSDGETQVNLGHNSLSMNSLGLIAASTYDGDRLYIFTPDGGGGYTEAKLVASGGNGFDGNVSINDAGIVFVNRSNSLASIYTSDGFGSYTELQLAAPDTNSTFSINGVVADDGTIVVSSMIALYVHEPDGSSNYVISKRPICTGADGTALAVNEAGVIVVGAKNIPLQDGATTFGSAGGAYVYVPDGSGGYTEYLLTAVDATGGDTFGFVLSINEGSVITVGSRDDDDKGPNSGSVYVFTPDEDGNYVGFDGTVYEPSNTPVELQTFDSTSLTFNGSEAAEVLKEMAGMTLFLGEQEMIG